MEVFHTHFIKVIIFISILYLDAEKISLVGKVYNAMLYCRFFFFFYFFLRLFFFRACWNFLAICQEKIYFLKFAREKTVLE